MPVVALRSGARVSPPPAVITEGGWPDRPAAVPRRGRHREGPGALLGHGGRWHHPDARSPRCHQPTAAPRSARSGPPRETVLLCEAEVQLTVGALGCLMRGPVLLLDPQLVRAAVRHRAR